MKKKNIYLASALALMASAFTGCIEETFPESSSATSEQVGASSSALEAALNGIPSQMVESYYVYEEQVHETDLGFQQYMIMMTELLGDLYSLGSNTGYDWFRNYNTCDRAFGENTYFAYLPWFTGYKLIKAANDVIGAVNIEDESVNETLKGMAGAAYACRAMDYYILTVLYEPVQNIYTDCSKVLGLTVPKVTESTTGEEAKNNSRLTHDEMIAFILSDLDTAEKLLADYTPASGLPTLSVVYGLKAKVYMWDEDYANAATYARKAIDEFGGSPMTETQWLDVTSGFNTANQAWMWYSHRSAEGMGNLANFIGWVSPEADWGYSSLSCPGIDRSLYDHIADTDFRKHAFLDPDKYDYYDYQTVRGSEWIEDAPNYLSLKFRCVSGDYETYSVGAAADIPFMRVEEMYLIEAYATGASQGVSAGVAKLNSFMQSYRQPDYNYTGSDLREFEKEVLSQLRVEFWCEGQAAFPVAKILKPDVIQNYEGTNAPADIYKINFKGIKPNWNFVIPLTEIQANPALEGMNNPDPTGTFSVPVPVGEFAPANY
jgi:hypothetical protein